VLHRELKHARAAYLAAAEAWAARSKDYQDDSLRMSALGYSNDFSSLAAKAPGQALRADAFRQEVGKLLPILRESRQAIDDFALFLETYPTAQSNAEAERYLDAIQLYVKQFEQFEGMVDRYRSGLYPAR
jgi:hypothetical protein